MISHFEGGGSKMALKILVKSKLCAEFDYEENENLDDEDYEPEYDVKSTVTKKLRKLKKVEENTSNDVGSEAFKTLETDLNAFQETGIWNCSLCQNKEKTFSHKFQLVTHWHETHSSKDAVFEVCQWCMELFFSPGSSAKVNNGILLPKLF